MKKVRLKHFTIICILSIMVITLLQSTISYSQSNGERCTDVVDNKMVTVNNFRRFIEITPKENRGLTGYIIAVNSEQELKDILKPISRIAERGYNVYIIKNRGRFNRHKVEVGKSIVKKNGDNLNWVISEDGQDEKFAKTLNKWMNKKGYKSIIIPDYIKNFESNKDNDEKIREISNELHKLRNKI